jgi:hypothetical protein
MHVSDILTFGITYTRGATNKIRERYYLDRRIWNIPTMGVNGYPHRTLKKTCRYLYKIKNKIKNIHIFETAYKIEYPGSGCVSNFNNCKKAMNILPRIKINVLCMPHCF